MVWESTAIPLMICMNASRSSGSGRRSLVIKAIPSGHYLARGNARRKERFISESFLRDGGAWRRSERLDPPGGLEYGSGQRMLSIGQVLQSPCRSTIDPPMPRTLADE